MALQGDAQRFFLLFAAKKGIIGGGYLLDEKKALGRGFALKIVTSARPTTRAVSL